MIRAALTPPWVQMSEAALPSSWAEARDVVLANAPWIFLLIAGERAFDDHYIQASVALFLCVMFFGVAIYWKVFEGLTKPAGRHRLSFILMTIGALILAAGIYFLATREATHEDKAKVDELNSSLKSARDANAILDRQIASIRSEIQNLQSRLDSATRSTQQATALTPEQQEFQALLQINKNLTSGDRQRLSDALFDLSKYLDHGAELFAEANQSNADYKRLIQSSADPTQVVELIKKFEHISSEAMDFKQQDWSPCD